MDIFTAKLLIAGVLTITVSGAITIVIREVVRILRDNPHDDVDISIYREEQDDE